tara:strand:- start:29 stop:202 length:174 start_codon:yes stop_codon:yes gene_type:complete
METMEVLAYVIIGLFLLNIVTLYYCTSIINDNVVDIKLELYNQHKLLEDIKHKKNNL